MPGDLIRVLSDLHYGDHASRLKQLRMLTPLFDHASSLVLNGDSLDTRQGPAPQLTAELRAEVLAFFSQAAPPAQFLTGNHDPDISAHHHADFAEGRVFVTHGDVLFDDLVPWSRELPHIKRLMAQHLAALPAGAFDQLDPRLAVLRRTAASLPQRHQSKRLDWTYLKHLANDTFWPPTRVLRILRAWREAPRRAGALIERHRPHARFIVIGHTHKPGIWRRRDGRIVINTGSFCPPFGGLIVDLNRDALKVRQVVLRNGEYRLGERLAEFPLARP